MVYALFCRQIAQCEDLTVVRDGLLLHDVWVADVGEDDFTALGVEAFGFHNYFSSHDVLLHYHVQRYELEVQHQIYNENEIPAQT